MKDIFEKLRKYKRDDIIFGKKEYKELLITKRGFKEDELKSELLSLKDLKAIEPDIREFRGRLEERYRLYFVYSNRRGRCYILKLNEKLKIVTVYTLGRKTLNKWRKKIHKRPK